MTWLYEDPWPIIWIGGAALALLIIGWYNSRHRGVLAAIVGVALLMAAGLFVEQAVVTEREEVEMALDDAAAAVRANDVPRVLSYIAPEAQGMRGSVQQILPALNIVDAKINGNLKIEIRPSPQSPTATASFFGKIVIKKNQGQGDAFGNDTYVRPFTVKLRKEGGRWMMTEYSTEMGGHR